jgi:hypothetical protein
VAGTLQFGLHTSFTINSLFPITLSKHNMPMINKVIFFLNNKCRERGLVYQIISYLNFSLEQKNQCLRPKLILKNWVSIYKNPKFECILPILYWRFDQLNSFHHFELQDLNHFRMFYANQLVRQLKLLKCLQQIAGACQRMNLPVVVLKGGALAYCTYPEPTLRPMGDIDLLVPFETLAKYEQILLDLGYKPVELPFYYDWKNHHHHLAPYRLYEDGINIELHWHLVRPNTNSILNIERMFEQAVADKNLPTGVLRLCANDIILHVCLHLLNSFSCRNTLQALCDIVSVINILDHEIKWEEFILKATTQRIASQTYYSLWLICSLSGDIIPASVVRILRRRVEHTHIERNLVQIILRETALSPKKNVPAKLIAEITASASPLPKILAYPMIFLLGNKICWYARKPHHLPAKIVKLISNFFHGQEG